MTITPSTQEEGLVNQVEGFGDLYMEIHEFILSHNHTSPTPINNYMAHPLLTAHCILHMRSEVGVASETIANCMGAVAKFGVVQSG